MKRITTYLFLIILTTLVPVTTLAQHHNRRPKTEQGGMLPPKKFDPGQYQRDLEAFITKYACLTEQEAQNFFPIFREMQQKTRAIYMKGKRPNMAAFTDDKLALEAIRNHDLQEIEIKKLQQQYHNRFLKVLPATKVLKCIFAEDSFNKKMMRNIGK